MSTALFFITHTGIASNLLKTAEAIVRNPNTNLAFTEVPMDSNNDIIINEVENKLKQLEIDDGIFFITDIYGSTPSNIAQQLAGRHRARLITGVNLPMVIRLFNYRDEPMEKLLDIALEGAHKGIETVTTTL